MKFLQVEVNQQNYLINTDCILELLPYKAPTPTTYNSKLIDGIITHKDKVIPIVSIRRLLDFETFKKEQLAFISKVEGQHVTWVKEFEHSLQTGKKFSKALDPHQCALGKWIDETLKCLRCNNNGFVDLISKEIIPYHNALHESGREFLQDNESDIQKKMNIINEHAQNTLDGLKILEKEIDRLTSSFEQIVLMHIDGKDIGVVVDRIDKTHDLDEKNFFTSTENFSPSSKYLQFVDYYEVDKRLLFSVKFTKEFNELFD